MYFSLEIEPSNNVKLSQFELVEAVGAIYQKLSEEPEAPPGTYMGPVTDSNGNTIGHWLFKK